MDEKLLQLLESRYTGELARMRSDLAAVREDLAEARKRERELVAEVCRLWMAYGRMQAGFATLYAVMDYNDDPDVMDNSNNHWRAAEDLIAPLVRLTVAPKE